MTRGGLGALVLAATLAGAAVAAQPEAFDPARAWTHLERLVALGPRPAGSPALRQARAYITRELAVVGLTVQEQPFTAVTPAGRVEMVNLIVRLPGRRQDRIILAGHYDTKPLPGGTFVGANDGGSSAAFLIELARVLQTRDREFTWEIAWFDGEEAFCANWSDCGTPESPDNTYGSRHYVAEAQRAGALPSVRALILVDMIADRQLRFLRESGSTRWLVDLIWETADRLGHGDVFVNQSLAVEDDHQPFLDAGVPAIDIIDLDYPPWHTPGDTIDKLDPQGFAITGDVLIESLPAIEKRLIAGGVHRGLNAIHPARMTAAAATTAMTIWRALAAASPEANQPRTAAMTSRIATSSHGRPPGSPSGGRGRSTSGIGVGVPQR